MQQQRLLRVKVNVFAKRPVLHTIMLFGLCASFLSAAFAQPAPVYDIESLQPTAYAEPEGPPEPTVSIVQGPMPSEEPQQFIPASEAPVPEMPVRESNEMNDLVVRDSKMMPADQRLNRIEQQLRALQTNESPARIESLQSQVQDLRGQVERLSHALTQLEKRKPPQIEAEKRLAQVQIDQPDKAVTQAVVDVPNTEKSVEKLDNRALSGQIEKLDLNAMKDKQLNVDEEQQIYQSAYTLIKSKKYAEAVNVLQQMLKKYPKGQFASNAHYWLGELFGLQGNTDKALEEFTVIVKSYPKSPRISDAQLKVGLILASQLKWSQAKTELKKVISHYPGTSSAKTAAEQLKQIKQAGH